jgi:hypothetical protein
MRFTNPSDRLQRFSIADLDYEMEPGAVCAIADDVAYVVATRRMVLVPAADDAPLTARVVARLPPDVAQALAAFPAASQEAFRAAWTPAGEGRRGELRQELGRQHAVLAAARRAAGARDDDREGEGHDDEGSPEFDLASGPAALNGEIHEGEGGHAADGADEDTDDAIEAAAAHAGLPGAKPRRRALKA